MSATLTRYLRKLQACDEAVIWSRPYPDLRSAWDACEHADWMCWLLVHLYPPTEGRVRLVLCACARTALRHVPDGEDSPRLAIETAERYARGEATDEELARASASAARAASDAAWAARAASDAASAAWAASAARAARAAAFREMAVIVRRLVPDPEHLPAIESMSVEMMP